VRMERIERLSLHKEKDKDKEEEVSEDREE
jgi:hypothetical protein